MMVPDCHKRLETALADLKATLVRHKNSVSVSINIVHYFLRPFQGLYQLQAELKESNEQGAEIGEAESTIAEVEAVVKPTED